MKRAGYSVVELLVVIALLGVAVAVIAGAGGVVYVAAHFIAKWW